MKILIACCFLVLTMSSFAQTTSHFSPVHIDTFAVGIEFRAKERFTVSELVVGHQPVKHLFDVTDPTFSSLWGYYFSRNGTYSLKLNERTDVSELKNKLLLAGKGQNFLKVVLKDTTGFFPSTLASRYNEKHLFFEVLYETTVCEEVKRIFYREVVDQVRTAFESATTRRKIDLDSLFNKVLDDTIEPYLENLDIGLKNSPCFKDFELLQWLRGESAYGFGSGKYMLTPVLKKTFDPIIENLLTFQTEYDKAQFELKIIGYTDPQPVDGIKLVKNQTGIPEWRNDDSEFGISYANCFDDELLSSPFYMPLVNIVNAPIETLTNNCQLGAARAYVVAKYFGNRLRDVPISLYYSTGGIRKSTVSEEDTKKRMVEMQLYLFGAKEK